jgi:transposase
MTAAADDEAEILRLHYAEHWPVGTISSQRAVHPDVVRRVLGLDTRPRPLAKPRPLLVAPYHDFLVETLKLYPKLRATRLFDMVKARGYPGSVRTLRDYVVDLRPTPTREAFLRSSPLIGEQAQVDWAHVADVPVAGGTRALWLFVIVLAWSRAIWAEFVFDLSVHSLRRSLVRAAKSLGGCPRQWLFDNPKTVVLERQGDAVRFHPLLLDLCGALRVQPRLCTVRKANQKGRVERAIRYLRDRFLGGRVIASIEQGNAELLRFLEEIAGPRPHPTIPGRSVAECFAEEQTRLLPVPEPLPPTDEVLSARADKTAFVHFDRNVYSVPPTFVERAVTIAADDRVVRILDGNDVVATHQRRYGKREVVESTEHRVEILRTKRGAAEGKGQDRLRAALPGFDRLVENWVEAGRNIGSMTARTLKLLDLYGDALVAEATAEVFARGTHDPGAIAQVCEQRRRAQQRPVPIDVALGAHVPDRDVVPHDLEVYDVRRR